MRRLRKVQVFVFAATAGTFVVLLLKQTEERGGAWQPITGAVRPHERLEAAARREAYEETGIILARIHRTGHEFTFWSEARKTHVVEHVFASTLPGPMHVRLSAEHTESRWVALEEADALLGWPSNRRGLTAAANKMTE